MMPFLAKVSCSDSRFSHFDSNLQDLGVIFENKRPFYIQIAGLAQTRSSKIFLENEKARLPA